MVALGAGARPYSPVGRLRPVSVRAAPVTRVEEARGLLPGSPLAEYRRDPARFSPYDAPIGAPGTHAGENRFLYAIISTVGSSLELDEVLGAVVRLLSDASARCTPASSTSSRTTGSCSQAASEPYEHLVGEIALERGEGLAWWAAEHKEPGVHPRRAARRPAREVRPRARGGALPVARLRPDRRQGRQRDRRHLEPHRGAARVHGGRGRRSSSRARRSSPARSRTRASTRRCGAGSTSSSS